MPKNAVNSVALSGVAALVKASGRKALGISGNSGTSLRDLRVESPGAGRGPAKSDAKPGLNQGLG